MKPTELACLAALNILSEPNRDYLPPDDRGCPGYEPVEARKVAGWLSRGGRHYYQTIGQAANASGSYLEGFLWKGNTRQVAAILTALRGLGAGHLWSRRKDPLVWVEERPGKANRYGLTRRGVEVLGI